MSEVPRDGNEVIIARGRFLLPEIDITQVTNAEGVLDFTAEAWELNIPGDRLGGQTPNYRIGRGYDREVRMTTAYIPPSSDKPAVVISHQYVPPTGNSSRSADTYSIVTTPDRFGPVTPLVDVTFRPTTSSDQVGGDDKVDIWLNGALIQDTRARTDPKRHRAYQKIVQRIIDTVS